MLISKFKKENEEVSTAELEALVGLKLPEQYLIFLRKYNGGNTPNTNWTGKCKSDVRYFYGLNVGDKNRDIAHNLTYASVRDLIKQNKFPIAENCSGDDFCLDCSDGSVWFVAHDSPFRRKIADDFNSFIAGCKSKPIDDFAKKTPEEIERIMTEKGRGNIITEGLRTAWKEQYEKYKDMTQEEVIVEETEK